VNSPGELRDRVWIVVAAFNEAAVIGGVVRGLRAEYSHVVVVDDGSSDDTAQQARAAGAIVLRHVINLGQGAALQTGMDLANRESAEFVVTFDADGQHRVADIAPMVNAAIVGGVDVVLGSRFLGATVGMPGQRRIAIKAAALFTALTTGLWLTDAHNGLRVLTRKAARVIRLRQNRMAHASEIITQIARLGLSYTEHPITIEYTAYSLAKGQKLSDSLRILADLAVERLKR
jgi:glycosyltransferase involved in cell wall biosynthesis